MTAVIIECPGDPQSIRAAGEWMRHNVESAVNTADIDSGLIAGTSYQYWEGESGTAFNNVANDLLEATRELNNFAGAVAEKFHVFAGEVERVQDKYAGYLEHAQSFGLLVQGTTVYRPEWVGAVPQSDDDDTWDEWRDVRKKQREYDRIQEDVFTHKAELIGWVAENLFPIVSTLSQPTLAQQLYEKLSAVVGLGTSIGGDFLDNYFANSIDRLNENAAKFAEDAAEIERRSTASGNPATRAQLRELIQQNLPEHLRSASSTATSISELTKGMRQIADRVLGPGADVLLGAWEIAEGAEPVDVGIEYLGGLAGGGVAIALGATPVGWGIVIIGGAGVIGGEIVGGIWGATPESWREGIYHWVDDGIDIGGDVVDNVGDWFYDTSEAIGGWFR